jgi:glutathione synthase
VRIVESWDFEVDPSGRLLARAHAFNAPLSKEAICAQLQFHGAKRVFVEVQELDALLVRINPLDPAVLAFAQLAARSGVCVLNDPHHLAAVSHKSFLSTLRGVPRPETLVTRAHSAIRHFASNFQHGVVIKPARASGGRGVVFVPKPHGRELDKAIDQARMHGDGYLVVQEYLPEAALGEKRLLWVGGRVLGAYRRMRAPGEFRHNLKHGAKAEACALTDSDYAIERALTEHLSAAGVWFAGLDVIGGKLIEVNALNPGGSHFIEETSGLALGPEIVLSLEKEISSHRAQDRDMEQLVSPTGWAKQATKE